VSNCPSNSARGVKILSFINMSVGWSHAVGAGCGVGVPVVGGGAGDPVFGFLPPTDGDATAMTAARLPMVIGCGRNAYGTELLLLRR
jgi:hypothetical protein